MDPVDRRRFIAMAGTGLAAVAAAACGDEDDSSPPPEATSPTSGGSPAARVEATTDAATAGLRWFGQSMFLLTSPGGTRILLDPFGPIGYPIPAAAESQAVVATISHEHPDHNNPSLAGSAAEIVKGLTADGWNQFDKRFGDVRIF